MKLEIYQWLGPLISIYYIVRTLKQFSQKKYSPRNTIIWITFWIGIASLCLLPDEIPNALAKGLGFRDHINAIIFVALALLFLATFYLSAALNRVENQLTELIRQLALERAHQSNRHVPNPNLGFNLEENRLPLEITESEEIMNEITDLENIVNEMNPRNTDENSANIPNAGKTPKSKPKK